MVPEGDWRTWNGWGTKLELVDLATKIEEMMAVVK
jgi:hypothetical protein